MCHRRRPLDPSDALTKFGKKEPCRIEHVPSLFSDSSLVKTALVIAGGFTFLPGRIMHAVVFSPS